MTNLVIGAVTNYTYYDIEPWLVSLKKTGYKGDIALACFNVHQNTIKTLKEKGVICIVTGVDIYGNAAYGKKEPWNICVDRFLVYSRFLEKNLQYEKVILTDVKDVIFQYDPFDYEYNVRGITYSYEQIQYEHEPWAVNNFKLTFGDYEYERMKSNVIINAGVIGGSVQTVKELCDQIFQICLGKPPHIPGGGGPDQAVLNYLLNQNVWRSVMNFPGNNWACQAGTMKDPTKIEQFRDFLYVMEPYMENDIIKTCNGTPFAIVHQYDRAPEWKQMVERKYRDTP